MFRIWRSDKDNSIYVKNLTKINMKKIKNYEFPVILMLMVIFLLSDNQSLLIGTKKSFLLFYRYNIEKKKIITYREIAGIIGNIIGLCYIPFSLIHSGLSNALVVVSKSKEIQLLDINNLDYFISLKGHFNNV